jgi:hypothetical protein
MIVSNEWIRRNSKNNNAKDKLFLQNTIILSQNYNSDRFYFRGNIRQLPIEIMAYVI